MADRTADAVAEAIAPGDEDAARLDARARRAAPIHLTALTASKLADGLADPKLVLAWLLNAVGAPGLAVGALVPVREAGALLPQLRFARIAASARFRKRLWSAGAAVQGLAALAIAAAALTLEGAAAGAAVIGALAVLSLARALCSVSHKDAVAATLPKTRRGAVGGLASSVAAAGTLGFGALLAFGALPMTVPVVCGAVALAGALFLFGSAVFAALPEPENDAAGDTGGRFGLAPLRRDPELARFVLARALLTATAFSPPFILLAAGAEGRDLGALGPLVVASGLAYAVSGRVWGRLSDRSSRLTLAAGAALGAATLGTAAWLASEVELPAPPAAVIEATQALPSADEIAEAVPPEVTEAVPSVDEIAEAVPPAVTEAVPSAEAVREAVGPGAVDALAAAADRLAAALGGGGGALPYAPVVLFLAALSHAAVRTGRKTHLTDMAPDDARAAWTAAANTAIGLVLLAGAGLGLIADAYGAAAVLALLSALCLVAIPAALALREVQRPSGDADA